MTRCLRSCALVAAVVGAACGETTGPSLADGAILELEHLATPDPATEGHLELWLFADGAPVSAGRLAPDGDRIVVELADVPARPDSAVVTLEPPGDASPGPSRYRLLRGRFRDGRAELGVEEALTNFFPLEEEPGAHSLYTTSNNAWAGYPSLEDCGMWLFNMFPATNPTGERWVQLTQLKAEWTYEGWIVYRPGTPGETWISYGKFRPDSRGFLTSRDNTGSGPFSGDLDFRNGGVEEVPGDEWTTPNPDYSLPAPFEPPLDLNEMDDGVAVWHHAITIEPAFDESEPLRTETPFVLRPYGNPIGEGDAHVPRFIQFRGNEPRALIRPRG
jgi:hypothetical protein